MRSRRRRRRRRPRGGAPPPRRRRARLPGANARGRGTRGRRARARPGRYRPGRGDARRGGGAVAADGVVVAVVAALEGTRAGAHELADDVVASAERGELDERDAATKRPPARAREPRRGRDGVVEAKLAELHHAETRHRSLVDGVHERARLRIRRRATIHVETKLQRVVRLPPRARAKVLVNHGAVARRRAMWLAEDAQFRRRERPRSTRGNLDENDSRSAPTPRFATWRSLTDDG